MGEWAVARLGDIADLGFGKTPPRAAEQFWAGSQGHAWATIADLRRDPVTSTAERIADAGLPHAGRVVPEGGVMMSFKLTVGRVARAGIDLLTNEAIVSVAGRPGVADDGWLYHALPAIAASGVTDTAVKGATLNKFKLERLRVIVPPLKEQRRIAEILDTIDETIQATEHVIAKLRRHHTGLAEHLTKRPPNAADWMLRHVSEVVDATRPVTYGIVQPGPRQPEGQGVPMIRGKDYDNDVVRTEGLYWVLPSIAAPYARSSLRPGDLVLTIVGVSTGTVGEVPKELDGANLTQTTARLAPGPAINGRYFFHYLQASQFQQEVARHTVWSTRPRLNIDAFGTMEVLVPPRNEQARIAETLDASMARIGAEAAQLSKLRALRSGLMDDLLSGRVRTVAA